MGSLTARGRAAVVVAFVLSAAAASGAAVALVKAADDERTPGTTLPRVQPTLVTQGSATPTPSAAPTQAPATATPTPAPSTSATAAPSASATTGPHAGSTGGKATYLSAKADLEPVSDSAYQLVVRASDGDDEVVLSKVTWGDGASASSASGTPCSATPGGDCQVFTLSHAYAQGAEAAEYAITVLVTAGKERVVLTLHAGVAARPAASATPSASATP